jgi:hypothetical protein
MTPSRIAYGKVTLTSTFAVAHAGLGSAQETFREHDAYHSTGAPRMPKSLIGLYLDQYNPLSCKL